jgi:dienelactone hydrolase
MAVMGWRETRPRRLFRWGLVAATGLATAVAGTLAPIDPADAATPTQGVPSNTAPGVCDEYAGDPEFGTQEWTDRDTNNVSCAYQRREDAQTSPAFHAKHQQQVAIEEVEFASTLAEWAAEPNRLHVNCCIGPQAKVGDPFRSPEEWAAAGRGRHLKFYFINRNGAKLRARLYAPVDSTKRYPAVTFTPGLQSYNEVNSWFAQGMAEAGYVVLIIDPQGQGDSENCGHAPDGTQTSCPSTNQPVDTRSAIDFIVSSPSSPYPWALGTNAVGTPTFNPLWENVDIDHVGIAGHSLGAIAVTPIGQEDPRVDAVISYDNLDQTLGPTVPRRTPSLFFSTDYAFPATGAPKASPPNPAQHLGAFDQLSAANVDTMSITTRASDHYEFSYQPSPADFPASRYGERVAFFYSLAWFDRYLKGHASATRRLTAYRFDDSSDRHSIGAGTYDAQMAASDPTNPFAGNVPYRIAGKCTANLLSFYFHSAYRLEGGTSEALDMRGRGCEDPDRDGDGVPNTEDNCADTLNGDQGDSDADAVGDVCDPETTIRIDVKPGADNTISARANGSVPVAILWSPRYDPVARTDRTSLTFGRTGNEQSLIYKKGTPQCTAGDVNGDAHADLTCSFDNARLGYAGTEGSTVAILEGKTLDRVPIVVRGRDNIRVKP